MLRGVGETLLTALPIYFFLQLRRLFITVSFVDVGFSIMRLFKDLQEVAYPGVHPRTVVSWDLEFVGTRGSFPTLVSLLHVFTSCHHIRFPPLITFQPQHHHHNSRLSHPQPRRRHPVPLTVSQVFLWTSHLHRSETLTTFRLLISAPFHALASILLNQLNWYPLLHLRVSSFISRLHHVSVGRLSLPAWISYTTLTL